MPAITSSLFGGVPTPVDGCRKILSKTVDGAVDGLSKTHRQGFEGFPRQFRQFDN
ncbi:MAG: hypothetical protein AB1589_42110 [Cyanobacteriota bacterium]